MRTWRRRAEKKSLQQMGSHLEAAGIVTEDFLPSVMKRESLSSTDFDYSIAIPHPLHPSCKRLDDFHCGIKRADSVESFPSETRNFTRIEGRGYGIHATLLTMAGSNWTPRTK